MISMGLAIEPCFGKGDGGPITIQYSIPGSGWRVGVYGGTEIKRVDVCVAKLGKSTRLKLCYHSTSSTTY